MNLFPADRRLPARLAGLAASLLVLAAGPAPAAPVNAATVKAFIADCAERALQSPAAPADACMSYLQGALDQIVLTSANTDCTAAFDKSEKTAEVWRALVEQAAHPLGGNESLWGGVRQAALRAVPACR